jgi:putative N6-adenine-specific DNA methylase
VKEAFVVCASHLEDLLAEELRELGIKKVRKGFRGLYVPCDMEIIYRVNYHSRIAMRLLWPLAKFPCRDAKTLYGAAREIDWSLYLDPNKTFAIDANVHHPLLKSSLYASQVLKDALCDQLRERFQRRPSVSLLSPDVQLNLFIEKGWATISFDTSGDPLYRRGYRSSTSPTEAPIQESLAAAILLYAGYSSKEILCDPFCGSGTFLIEAALIATQTPPGFFRKRWGFESLPHFSKQRWLAVKEEAHRRMIPLQPHSIFGADKGLATSTTCRHSLEAAGFEKLIPVTSQAIEHFAPPSPPTLIVCNPPYGKRVPLSPQLYSSLGRFAKERGSPQTKVLFLASDEREILKSDLKMNKVLPLFNGGTKIHLYTLG